MCIRDRTGTDYAGQVYVSMRGTNPFVDFVDDAVLAITGVAYDQLASMVNWWMRATAVAGQQVAQIGVFKTFVGGIEVREFVAANTATSTGELTGANAINSIHSVNGHSLGGYLATAFERIFGSQNPVSQLNTFNSAGFSSVQTLNINHAFNQIASLIGLPAGSFNPALQTNYFAENGIEVTTNTWKPIGFQQIGQRIALYQEDAAPTVIDNHYMYKITDLLALGDAISKLDPNFTITQLNSLVKNASNQMDASYEKLLDGLRHIIIGNVSDTLIGDTSSTETGSSRVNYHNNLKLLTSNAAFQALIGKVTISASIPSASEARSDLGAFLSLYYLTPFSLKESVAGALDSIYMNHGELAQQWNADRNLTPTQITNGEANFSDMYLADRAAMLSWMKLGNDGDIQTSAGQQVANNGLPNALEGATQRYHFQDMVSGTDLYLSTSTDRQHIIFGSNNNETGRCV